MRRAELASLVLLCIALVKASAEEPFQDDVESGFADELDAKYGAVDQSMASRSVVRQLVKFRERADLNGKIVSSSLSLDLGKDGSIMDLGSDEDEDRKLKLLLSGDGENSQSADLGEGRGKKKRKPEANKMVGFYDQPGRNGLFLRAQGSFTVMDWLTKYKAKPDILRPIKAAAMDNAFKGFVKDNPLPALPQSDELIELSETRERIALDMDDMATAEANALAAMKGSESLGDDDKDDSDGNVEDQADDYDVDEVGDDDDDDMGEILQSTDAGRRRRAEKSAMIQNKDIDPKRPGYQKRWPGSVTTDGGVQFSSMNVAQATADSLVKPANVSAITFQPTKAPTMSVKIAPKFRACYEDGVKTKALPYMMGDGRPSHDTMNPSSMTPHKCAMLCTNDKHKLMGLETIGINSFCYCGASTGQAERADRKMCRLPCAGAPEAECGAELYMSIFEVQPYGFKCWDGRETTVGLDKKKPWEGYRGCAVCDGEDPIANQERWQEWGQPMGHAVFAQCLSCDPLDAMVVTDPAKKSGFCRSYHPTVDKVITHTYPYFAHWDGLSDFVHTKLVQTISSPHMRDGKAHALCKLWKQVSCALNDEALQKSWIQATIRGTEKNMPQHRFLECKTRKTARCHKVCIHQPPDPQGEPLDCGKGGNLRTVFERGLEDELGVGDSSQQGDWCCYDKCFVPNSHQPHQKEDGSFWCKEPAMLL